MPRPRTESKSANQSSKFDALVSHQLDWFRKNARNLPWRRTDDPYAIWVSEIMLQQTQVKTVIPFWERWMRELPNIESLANASSEKIHKLWEGLGYYTRVRNMQKAAQFILANHGGRFPSNFEDVLALPGIGRYTAGAICSIAFNQPTPILDGNVIRVLTRVFGISENPKDQKTNPRLWDLAHKLVLHSSRSANHAFPCSHLNQSLMELGALICTPRSPRCAICPLQRHCLASKQGRTEELPNLGKRTEITERRFIAFVCEHKGKVLVRQRPAGVVNAHLWEFPNVECSNGNSNPVSIAAKILGFQPKAVQPLCTIRHSITRYRITLEAFVASTPSRNAPQPSSGQWLAMSGLKELSFPSAHKRILDRFADA